MTGDAAVSAAVRCIAAYGPFALSNPLSSNARLVLHCMAAGYESLDAISSASGLGTAKTIDAMHEIGGLQLVTWLRGAAWYRLGALWVNRQGQAIDEGL